jgi:hypothetical protein
MTRNRAGGIINGQWDMVDPKNNQAVKWGVWAQGWVLFLRNSLTTAKAEYDLLKLAVFSY